LEGAGGDSFGERPLDFRGKAGVSGVDPVDVPVLFDGDDEACLNGATGGDLVGERGEFYGEVRSFERAGATVAYFDDLGVGGEAGEQREGGGCGEEGCAEGTCKAHLTIVGGGWGRFVIGVSFDCG